MSAEQRFSAELPYRILTAEIPVKDYIDSYRDKERFLEYCRRCPGFGLSWACPPFEFNPEERLLGRENAFLIAARIEMPPGVGPQSDFRELLQPVRARLEKRLLELEEENAGLAFGFSGGCSLCGECARKRGETCRHPEKVRPALEAYGFDVCKSMEDIFHTGLEWASEGRTPRSLTLVGAIFHNSPVHTLTF